MSRAKQWIKRWVIRLAWLGLAGSLVAAAALALGYKHYVIDDESPHLERDYIDAVIARESPVLYRDGRTRVGVFFAQEHRQYTPYDDLPQAWVDAIVAAEDKRFFSHPGVDVEGITRAMVQNLQARRVVSGGSTLTQQTAKNLYYRPDRSLRSKWEELLNAMRLEHHYSKAQILEFYANQFHVSANGRGIGIAARYFFDKPVTELDLLESAFIAGMVKGPANYDPFIGRTPERQDAAKERAHARVRYVLGRMLAQEKLTQAELDAALADLDARFAEGRFFDRGRFRYDSHVLLDEVEARLAESPFPELFAELGIDNPSTAGIQIVTTVDADAQREATYAMWHHLSEVGPVLEEWTAAQLVLADTSPDALAEAPATHGFYLAAVSAVDDDGIVLSLGPEGCTVDDDGVRRVATVLAQARKGERWRKASADDIKQIRSAVSAGDVVYASVRAPGVCDLEIRPELQGALVVLDRGRVRAMVGGNDNRNFNRAVTARRQLGSTWKPLIYDAAMQLNWLPLDPLDNREGAFPFEGVWYYPRAAHEAPDTVSLAWAGTHSENLSSVWLLYHLTDKLSTEQFAYVAEQVGMRRLEGEEASDYLVRVRDEFGVISTRERIPEIAWTAARLELAAELTTTDPALALEIQSLLYAGDAERESDRVRRRYSGNDEARRLSAIGNNPHRLVPLAEQCAAEAQLVFDARARAGELLEAAAEDARRPLLRLFGGDEEEEAAAELLTPIADLPSLAGLSHLITAVEPSAEGALSLACGEAAPEGWRPLSLADLEAVGRAQVTLAPGEPEALRIEDRLTVGALLQLDRSARRRALVMAERDPYSFEALQYHPDFRLLVGIRYAAQLAQSVGVQTELPPVMSMPLGAADITLEEAALMYQGLLTGLGYRFPGQKSLPGAETALSPVAPQVRNTQLISQIRDHDGNVLYRAQSEPLEVSDPVAGVLTAGVLHNVVQWGTGRRARGAVTVGEVPVPVFGKTGTTNSYKNAAFCGFVPAWKGGGWSWDGGFTIAAYVGYDDNRPMRRGSVRLAGSSGALPAWIGTAQGLADAGLLGEPEPNQGWMPNADFVPVPVLEGSGLPAGEGDAADSGRVVWMWGQRAPWSEDFTPLRRFTPVEQREIVDAPPLPDAVPDPDDVSSEEALDEVWIPEMEL